ncbi:MAG: hypothetical protein ACRD22_17095, partial [Terriglobia bacterium]
MDYGETRGGLRRFLPAITDNIHQKLLEFAKGAKSLNVEQFQSCLDNQMSLGLVLRDINLASDNKID